MGRLLIILGIALVLAGILSTSAGKIPFLGRLPGDIHIQRKNFSLFFPLGSSIVLSVILSLLLSYFLRK